MSLRPIVASFAQNGTRPHCSASSAAPAVVLAHDRDGLARSQVIARRRLSAAAKSVSAEVRLEHLGSDEQPEPAAHVTP